MSAAISSIATLTEAGTANSSASVVLVSLIWYCLVTVVPFLSGVFVDVQHLSQDKCQAGDRHLKFHEIRDNLQVFPDTPSDDRTMLMLAGDFEGPASDIQVVRPGGEPVPMQQVPAPDECLIHDQSGTGPDSVRTVSARELVDSAITATQRHVQEAIAVFESGQRGRGYRPLRRLPPDCATTSNLTPL